MPETVLRVVPLRSRADEWALVLAAEGLAPAVRALPEGFALCVPEAQAGRAGLALAAYERENPARPAPAREPVPVYAAAGRQLGASSAAALLLFFAFVRSGLAPRPWHDRGAADAVRMLSGEPWRALTALTLHADLPHVVSNAVVGGVFLAAVGRVLGPGLGVALAVAAGALGNLVNAVAHGPAHVSVGASTAVFGAVGVLAGVAVRQRRYRGVRGRRVWAPVGAGLGILAMLGTGGARVDLWAHLFGLLAGAALGLAAAPAARRPPGRVAQTLWGVATLVALAGAWAAASVRSG